MPSMARTARSKQRRASGWPAVEAGILQRLANEPSAQAAAAIVALFTLALYLSSAGYPLVFGDFAFLGDAQLEHYARALPALGGTWLAEASFGWSAAAFGTQWPWHRALNFALHAAAAVTAFALFRRILAAAPDAKPPIAAGWVAFAAAALFALHPAAVYAVAYLSARWVLLLGLFGLAALWSTARTLQTGSRSSWLLGPAAVALALASSPAAVGIPLAMAFLALALPAADARARRLAWFGAASAAAIAAAHVLAWVAAAPTGASAAGEGAADAPAYLDALAAACSRFLAYLGFWLVPWTGRMAIDMPEPAISAASVWPGWLGLAGVAALAALIAVGLRARRNVLLRAAAIGLGCALALDLPGIVWPRLAEPFALTRSFAFMPYVVLVPAGLVAMLPARAAWAAACLLLFVWLAAAADTLQTFSSHVALWDDAVRRAERTGPAPQDARIYLNRATVHRRDGHAIAALADYDKALALQPGMVRALRGRAQVYVDEKRYGEALRDLDRLLELEPGHAIIHADRGLVMMQAGRYNDAGLAFDRAIKQGVREPRVYLNRGLARLQLGGLGAAPAALADIEQAIKLDPSYALAYYNRAMVFEQAAAAGIRVRDALSPELMRAVAEQNLNRACQLGHDGACERLRSRSEQALPGAPGPIYVTPETLRRQGLPER